MQLTQIDKTKIANAKQWLRGFHGECFLLEWGSKIDWSKLYVAGGAFASMLQGDVPKDVDIYCSDEKYADKLKSELTTKHYIEIADASQYREYYDENGKMVSEWAITMKNTASFIFRNSGEPKSIKSTFDFVHTTPHYEFQTSQEVDLLYISPLAYHCAVNKLLIPNNPKTVTPARIEKFKSRGYTQYENASNKVLS
jgi:hypothetical protein